MSQIIFMTGGQSPLNQGISLIMAFLGIVVVIFLALYTTRFIGKKYNFKNSKSKNIKLIETLTLGQDKCIIIVKATDKYLLLGVTAQNISVLQEINPESLDISLEQNIQPDFSDIFKKIIDKTTKKDVKNDKK